VTEIKPAAPEVRQRIDEDPDFIGAPHHENSLARLMSRYPDGVPPNVEARALGRSEAQVRALWAITMRQLRRFMGVTKGE